jgi:hypothetical protein
MKNTKLMALIIFILSIIGTFLNYFPDIHFPCWLSITLFTIDVMTGIWTYIEFHLANWLDDFRHIQRTQIKSVYIEFIDGTYMWCPQYIISVSKNYKKKRIDFLIKKGVITNVELGQLQEYNSKPKK